MKAWKKGAIVGFIWSILGFIVEIPIKEIAWLEIVFFFPIFIAKILGFVSYAAIIGGPIIGLILGALLGFLYDLRKEQKRAGKIELSWGGFSYWQKGAILGVIWSVIGFILMNLDLPVILLLIIALPAFISEFFGPSKNFWGLVFGFLLGALGGHIYGSIRRKEK